MKTIWIFILSIAALISFTQCSQITPEKLCADQSTRGKIISTLVNDELYMAEVMDSMRTIHPEVIVSAFLVLAQKDTTAQLQMMDKMMDITKSDTSMCREMFNKTMDMCNANPTMYKMMMASMESRPNAMKSIQEMCDRYNMIMEEANKEHHEHVHK